jgi:predicted MFS family arabinose efflux permease
MDGAGRLRRGLSPGPADLRPHPWARAAASRRRRRPRQRQRLRVRARGRSLSTEPQRHLRRLSLATFAYFLTLGLGIPTVPRYLTGPLGGTPVDVGVAVAIFSVTAILARPLVPPLAARAEVRSLLAIGAAAVGAATGLMTIAHSLPAVLALRGLAGLGDALFYVLASAAVYALAPEDGQASAQSRFSAVVSAGILLGPIVAETLRPHIGYTGIWLLGAALSTAAAACVLRLPLTREPATPHPHAALEPRAVLPGIVIAAQTWALSAFTIFVALYASRLGLDNADAPFAVMAAIVLTLRTIGAGLFDRFQPRSLAATAMTAATAGLALLALLPDTPALLAGSALLAISQALAFPALLQLAVQRAGVARRTRAVATFTGFFETGLASAAIVLGVALDRLGFAGLYGLAAAVSAAALLPLLLSQAHETTTIRASRRASDLRHTCSQGSSADAD